MENVDWINLAGDWDKLWNVLKEVMRFGGEHKIRGVSLSVLEFLGAFAKIAKNYC